MWKKFTTNWFNLYIDNIILFFIFVGIFSLFTEGLMTFQTISGIVLYFLLFYKHLILKKRFPSGVNKTILLFVFFFFLSLFISAIFSEMPFYSLKWIKKSYWVSIPLGLSILSIAENKYLFNVLWAAFLTAGIFNNLHFYIKAIKIYHIFNPFSSRFVPDRNYTSYIGMIFPFFLSGLLVFHKLIWKVFCFLNILLSFCLFIPIGSRGAYGTLALETFLVIFFAICILWKKGYQKAIITVIIFIVVISLSLSSKYYSHPMIKAAFKRGLSPNGRDMIIKDRFFIIFKEHPILGIGYGRLLYFNFLEKHKVPKRYGHYDLEGKRFVYHSDEGLFLQTIIRQGIIGFLAFLGLFFSAIKETLKKSLMASNLFQKIFYFSLFSIFICHYLFRGFVETLSLTQFFVFAFLVSLPLDLRKYKNENSFYFS